MSPSVLGMTQVGPAGELCSCDCMVIAFGRKDRKKKEEKKKKNPEENTKNHFFCGGQTLGPVICGKKCIPIDQNIHAGACQV